MVELLNRDYRESKFSFFEENERLFLLSCYLNNTETVFLNQMIRGSSCTNVDNYVKINK